MASKKTQGESHARRFEERFAGAEVVVEGAVGDAGLVGDLVDGRRAGALACEHPQRGVEEQRAGRARAGAPRRRSERPALLHGATVRQR